MTTLVATRELKTRLARYLRLVKRGQTVVVTDRGRPVAEIRPLSPQDGDEESVLEALAAQGAVTLPTRAPLAKWRPVRVEGAPFSETLLARREERP